MYLKASSFQDSIINIETKEHIENMINITMFIASFFNFSQEELYSLKISAKFHDIGKVQIPLEILNKPEKLTPEEYNIMKKHSQYGKDILMKFGFSEYEVTPVYQHHERCSGNGYPLGLTRDEIDIRSKIVGIADVIDALLSKRCYKEAWETDTVKQYFIDNPEKLCYKVIKIVLENWDEILKLRK